MYINANAHSQLNYMQYTFIDQLLEVFADAELE